MISRQVNEVSAYPSKLTMCRIVPIHIQGNLLFIIMLREAIIK